MSGERSGPTGYCSGCPMRWMISSESSARRRDGRENRDTLVAVVVVVVVVLFVVVFPVLSFLFVEKPLPALLAVVVTLKAPIIIDEWYTPVTCNKEEDRCCCRPIPPLLPCWQS